MRLRAGPENGIGVEFRLVPGAVLLLFLLAAGRLSRVVALLGLLGAAFLGFDFFTLRLRLRTASTTFFLFIAHRLLLSIRAGGTGVEGLRRPFEDFPCRWPVNGRTGCGHIRAGTRVICCTPLLYAYIEHRCLAIVK